MHNQSRLVIWGASGHALVVSDIVRQQGMYTIVGFLDDVDPSRSGEEFCGSTVLGGRELLDQLQKDGITHILLGFGNCNARLELTSFLQARGFSLPVAIHPRSVVAEDVVLGSGTVVAAGAVVNPRAKIGQSVIINTSASVDHECNIEDAAHICPGVHLAGKVTVGQAAHVGIGTTVIERVRIGRGAQIGAGAVVVCDIPEHAIAYGVPARIRGSMKL